MRPVAMRKHVRDFLHDEGGGYTIFGIFLFMFLCAIGGVAVDGANAYRVQTIMQATADAAAHAGLLDLPDGDAAKVTAVNYAELNMPPEIWGNVLAPSDAEVGIYDLNTRAFVPTTVAPNAVRVTLRSTSATGNGVPLSLLRIIGQQNWDIAVQAIAITELTTNDCINNGFFTGAKLNGVGSSNSFTGVCVHGQSELQVNSDVTIGAGSVFSSKSYSNLIGPGSGTTPMVEGENWIERDFVPPQPSQISSYIIPGLRDGSITPPPFITQCEPSCDQAANGATIDSLPCDLVPGTMYFIKDDDKIKDECHGSYVHDIAVVGSGTVDVGENMTLSNVLLATPGEMTIGSNSTLGGFDAYGNPNYCSKGGGLANGAVFLFAGSTLSVNSDATISGLQAVSNHELWVGSYGTGEAFTFANSRTMGINSSGNWSQGCNAPNLLGGTSGGSDGGEVASGWYLVR